MMVDIHRNLSLKTEYTVPYICPNCDHEQWVAVVGPPPDDPVECPECGREGELRGSGRGR